MTPQDLEVQEKEQQVQEKGEKTEASRYYVPKTDIHESDEALFISMEVPGVAKDSVEIELEKNILTVTGKIDVSKYDDLKPLYTEYDIGNFARTFSLSSAIDRGGISAKISDGVLQVHLPKVKEAAAKRIEVS